MTTTPQLFAFQSLLSTGAITSEMSSMASGEFVMTSVSAAPVPFPVAFEDEPTLILNRPAENPLPPAVADRLVDGMQGVTPADVERLRGWMRERGLQAGIWTNAAQLLVAMRSEARALENAKRRYIDPGHQLMLYDGGRDLFWIGCNDPSAQVFLTHGNDTRRIYQGEPVRLLPGDVVTFGGRSVEFSVELRNPRFRRAPTPSVFSEDEPTVVTRRPLAHPKTIV